MTRTRKQLLTDTPKLGLAAMLMACVGTTTAMSQDTRDDWEYEPGEGYHEQEWYDPSDWFDAEYGGVDYEEDNELGYDYDGYGDSWDNDLSFDDTSIDYGTESYDYDGYYSSYYDGYYDGFNDDSYGFDTNEDWRYDSSEVADGFSDGYYDGYYDQSSGYTYDPYYYIDMNSTTSRDKNSDRQRERDKNRDRGDRQKKMAETNPQDKQKMQKIADQHRRSAKARGTVSNIEILSGARGSDQSPLMAEITMDDGKTVLANLGPKMTKQNLPFNEGDRITLCGKPTKNDGRKVLLVHTLQTGDRMASIASRDRMMRHGRSDRDDRRRTADRNRPNHESPRNVRVRGEVDRFRQASMNADRFTMYRIAMANGDSKLIAIKTDALDDMGNLDISSGDQITIEGQRRQVNGESVLVADRILINGEPLQVSSR